MNAYKEELKTSEKAFSGMEQGFKGTLELLDTYLSEV